jgi:hypothetical protein
MRNTDFKGDWGCLALTIRTPGFSQSALHFSTQHAKTAGVSTDAVIGSRSGCKPEGSAVGGWHSKVDNLQKRLFHRKDLVHETRKHRINDIGIYLSGISPI